ncbi:MAG: NUDIX hydrolase [Lachnospiraceae bacterium]|nr:NUDIX hydrolase [Lachnospiraceae bacterium]
MAEYKRLDRKLIRNGQIIDIYSDTIELPDGRKAEWDFIGHKGAAAIVPVDEDGNIIMVRQYRNAIDRQTIEIPAGGINKGEKPIDAAARELEEETGYKAGNIDHLIDLYTTVAYSNEMIYVYYTTKLIPSKQHLDDDEYVEVERYSLEELKQMILAGKIQDAKTIGSILAYDALRQKMQ